MATLSESLLLTTILGYLAAMFLYAAELSFGGRGLVAKLATRPDELAGASGSVAAGTGAATASAGAVTASAGGVATGAVGAAVLTSLAPAAPALPRQAGGGTAVGGATATGGAAGGHGGSGRDGRAIALVGRAAVWVTAGTLLAHAMTLVTRGLAAHRVPWGNMYEFVLAVTLVAAVAWLVLVFRRPATRPLGLFVTLLLVALLGLDATVLYTPVAPLVPALNSYWLKIHVSLAATASGLLLVGFTVAVLYLIRTAYDGGSRRFPASLGSWLPGAGTLERLAFRIHAFAFPIWTLAIIAGSIWAEAAWGKYWSWDPKETWALIAWIIYAGYLHARATPSIRRTTTAWIAVAGWAAMLMNLVFVNLFITGLHSYAGMN